MFIHYKKTKAIAVFIRATYSPQPIGKCRCFFRKKSVTFLTWTVKSNYLIILFLSCSSHLSPLISLLCKSKLEQVTESMQTQLNQSQITIFFFILDKNCINESKNNEAKEKKEASPFSNQKRSKRKKNITMRKLVI